MSGSSDLLILIWRDMDVWFHGSPLSCSLRPVSYPHRDSRWREHIDFKPRANGQPLDPATNLLSLVGVGNHPASQPTNQPASQPTCQLTIHPTTATTYPPSPPLLPRDIIANKPKPPWSTLVRDARLLILRAVDSFSMNTMPLQIISNMKTGNQRVLQPSRCLTPIRVGIPVDSALCRIK